MPALRTEITELVTGIATLGSPSVDESLSTATPPPEFVNVDQATWDRLRDARTAGTYSDEFEQAWSNGVAFLEATDGLRGRRPTLVEWKGPSNAPGYDFVPADLRVDHVFIVSCKYRSKILLNSSPTNLFRRLLVDRVAGRAGDRWYEEIAHEPQEDFYGRVRDFMAPDNELPATSAEMQEADVDAVRARCGGRWPDELVEPWRAFSLSVASASADIWLDALSAPARRLDLLWRMLRLGPAPYFVLGTSSAGPMRLRIGTPWDWKQHFRLTGMDTFPDAGAGQPIVRWRAGVAELSTNEECAIEGHVEVRWSHGRFSAVEAKVYLDTPHDEVAGYFPLV